MKPEECALVILAGGLSQRFGAEDKLMAELNGKPILQHVIDNVASIPFAEQLAVISTSSTARRNVFSKAGYTLIGNERPEAGQGRSIRLGAKMVVKKDHKSICVMLGDMPFVFSQHILGMMKGIKGKDKAISYCNKINLPPVLIRGRALMELTEIDGEMGAKSLLLHGEPYKHPLSKRAAQDIDTPEILASLQGIL